MEQKKRIVLIPDGESEFAVKVLRCLAQEPGITVNALSNSPWAAIRASKYLNKYIGYKTSENSLERVKRIIETAHDTKTNIILPVDVETIKLISQYSHLFSDFAIPPANSFETIELAADKGKLTHFLIENNIPAPDTIFGDEMERQDLTKLSFPVLVKKTDGRGGGGIHQYDDHKSLLRNLVESNQDGPYIVQSFVNGYDIDCSVLCKNGEILAYTIQKGIISPYSRFAPPAGIKFLLHEQVLAVAQNLMRALNWSGVAHIDMRYDEVQNSPKVIEVNPRFWGSLIGSLIAGINFPYLTCLLATDSEFPNTNYKAGQIYIHHKAAAKLAIQNIFPSSKEKIRVSGTGIEYVIADPFPEFINFLSGIKIFQR